MKLYIPCVICNKKAVWSYLCGIENYCDNCVPRGCTCNHDENGKEELDEQGRKQPCIEYSEIDNSSHNDKRMVDIGWEAYYKQHPEERVDEEDEWEDKFGRGGFERRVKPNRKLREW